MICAIVSVNEGNPDIDWSIPPLDSFQLTDAERYCVFPDGVTARASWTIITQSEYEAAKPAAAATQESVPDTTALLGQLMVQQALVNAEAAQKLDAIGQGLVTLQLK